MAVGFLETVRIVDDPDRAVADKEGKFLQQASKTAVLKASERSAKTSESIVSKTTVK